MLELLAAYLFLRCYVAFDPATSLPQRSGRTAEQCIAEFRNDAERLKNSRFVIGARDSYAKLAGSLSREQLDRLLADVRTRVVAAQKARK